MSDEPYCQEPPLLERLKSRLPDPHTVLSRADNWLDTLSPTARHFTAIAVALAAFGLRYAAFPDEARLPYLLALLVVIPCAAFLGLTPALLAALIGGALPTAFLPSDTGDAMPGHPTDLVGLTAYLTVATLLASAVRVLAAARKQAAQVLRQRDDLLRKYYQVLEDKEDLLESAGRMRMEIRHRTKNELMQIVALLNFQAREAETDSEKESLLGMSMRVQSVAHVHETLSRQMETPDQPVMSEAFLQGLVERISGATEDRNAMSWGVEVERFPLPHTVATSLGVVVTELAFMAVKRIRVADIGVGLVQIEFSRTDDEFRLVVADNAPPEPPGTKTSTVSIKVLRGLTQNLQGTLDIEEGREGWRRHCLLRFPVPKEDAPRFRPG